MSLTPLDSDSIESLFLRFYSFDAISLFVDILENLSKRCSELSVDLHTQDERQLRSKKILILKFEIIAKVCHYIENFRAFGYSFSKTRPSRDLIRESFRLISDYDVDHECFITRNSFHNRNLLKLIFASTIHRSTCQEKRC
jgi:hypothetical protein